MKSECIYCVIFSGVGAAGSLTSAYQHVAMQFENEMTLIISATW